MQKAPSDAGFRIRTVEDLRVGGCGGKAQQYRTRAVYTLPWWSQPAAFLSRGAGASGLVAGHDAGGIVHRQAAFGQQKTAQGPQIVEDAPAAGDMEIEFGQIIRDQEECFFATIRAIMLGRCNLFFHISAGFVDCLREHGYILVGPLDTVKRRFG